VAKKKTNFTLKKKTRAVGAGDKVTVKLKPIGKKKLKKLVKLVKSGAKAKAKITVTLTDSAGNATSEKVKVKLK